MQLGITMNHPHSNSGTKNNHYCTSKCEQNLLKVLNHLPALIGYWDRNLINVFANDAYSFYFKKTPFEIKGLHMKDVLGSELFEKNLPYIQSVLQGKPQNFEREIPLPDGQSLKYALASYIPDWSEQEVQGFYVIATDISQLKKLEMDLMTQKLILEQTLNAINAASIVSITDQNGKIQKVNQNFCHVSGYTQEELIGNDLRLINSGTHSKEFFQNLWSTIQAGKIWNGEIQNKSKSGKYFWVQTVIAPIRDLTENISNFIAIYLDITAEKNALKTLMNKTKMESLGEMAGNIAHEINNPLAIIQLKTSQMKQKIIEEKTISNDLNKELDIIDSTVTRIAKIISGLKAFSRVAENDPMETVDLRQIIDATLELCLERFSNHSIDIRFNFQKKICIQCRPVQISQVFMNLFSNSFDSIIPLNEKWIEIKIEEQPQWIRIFVIDSGKGIPNHLADRIMEPFFTTKEMGKGTGLGLSISKGIIEAHNGELQYLPHEENTTFCIKVPIQNEPLSLK